MPLSLTVALSAELLESRTRRPLMRFLELPGDAGEVLAVSLPDGTVNLAVCGGRTGQVSALIVTSDKAVQVCVGDVAQNEPLTLAPGGLLALLDMDVDAAHACALSYTPGDGSEATCLVSVLGTWVQGDVPPGPGPGPGAGLSCTQLAAHGLTSGLLACWDLEETSGSRVDHVGGRVLHEAGPVLGGNGHIGNGAFFSGEQNCYLYGVDILRQFELSNFTLAFWVRLRELPEATLTYRCVSNTVLLPDDAGLINYFFASILDNGVVEALVSWTSETRVQSTGPVDAQWTLVTIWQTVTGNQSQLSVQLNQGSIASVTGVIGPEEELLPQDFALGAFAGNPALYHLELSGDLDSVMVWNRALSPGERATIWHGGHG